jgi:NADPH2 dehydrogenase
VGVARRLNVAAHLKSLFPDLVMVGSGYSYLQEYLANVAQYRVRTGQVDFGGLGRMLLAYPDHPYDILTTGTCDRKRLCRTFRDRTTAPRVGLVSGCYPLDSFATSAISLQIHHSSRRTHIHHSAKGTGCQRVILAIHERPL